MTTAWPWHLASFVLLVAGFAYVVRPSSGRRRGPGVVRAATAILAFSVWVALLPHAGSVLGQAPASRVDSAFGALLMTVQAFAASLGVKDVRELVQGGDVGAAHVAEALYLGFLLTAAPILTIGFVLSFFEGMTTRLLLRWRRWGEVVVLTTFDERSVALAEELSRRTGGVDAAGRRIAYLFVGVDGRANCDPDLVQRATGLSARFVPGGVAELPRRWRKPGGKLRIVCMDENVGANLAAAERILAVDAIRTRNDADVYVVVRPETTRVGLHIEGRETLRATVHIIDPVRSGVYDWLWADATGDSERVLTARVPYVHPALRAVVIGVGTYGEQVLRALSWFGQLDDAQGTPYIVDLHGIDVDPARERRFRADYPGLWGLPEPATNPRQDAALSLHIHSGIDATTTDVDRILDDLDPVRLFWVATGDDARNLQIAERLRRRIARKRIATDSRTAIVVVLTGQGHDASLPTRTDTGVPGLTLFDALDSRALADAILDAPMEKAGRAAHLSWMIHGTVPTHDPEKWAEAARGFWLDLYSYRSSLATAIHGRARVSMALPGADKPASRRGEDELRLLRGIEHARWSAYVRSEGFVPGTKDTTVARTHHNLTDFDALPPEDQAKEDNDLTTALQHLEDFRRTLRPGASQRRVPGTDGHRDPVDESSPAGRDPTRILELLDDVLSKTQGRAVLDSSVTSAT